MPLFGPHSLWVGGKTRNIIIIYFIIKTRNIIIIVIYFIIKTRNTIIIIIYFIIRSGVRPL